MASAARGAAPRPHAAPGAVAPGAALRSAEELEVRARVHSLDVYSGHADRGELIDWVKARQPIGGKVFLIHGEEPALEGMRAAITPLVGAEAIEIPVLDSVYELTASGAVVALADFPKRLEPERLGHVDWHNDISRLILDMGEKLRHESDEKGRARLIRRLRRALDEEKAI